ncbi:AGAP012520-PA [Anopheles gambiae str. PEST]|uniref:AGAP012520-PA n=1 Tax=Anopheles gambiae TaxID=7165 RepID=Q7PEL1_ANOGA|nr:AGAP012520-PA [Anopheles gambiae str. PEST]
MKSFVERTRHDIVEWWERCMKSEDERARFTTFLLQDVNEDMLKLHERELDSLKQFYGENDQIFQMVLQRQEIWDRMLALEYKSNDPTRYNNRRGKLMEEEKHGRKFTVYGTPEEELIEEQWMQREESKHQQSSARKKANGVLGVSTVGRTSNRVADFDGLMLLQREQQSVAASDRRWFGAKSIADTVGNGIGHQIRVLPEAQAGHTDQ